MEKERHPDVVLLVHENFRLHQSVVGVAWHPIGYRCCHVGQSLGLLAEVVQLLKVGREELHEKLLILTRLRQSYFTKNAITWWFSNIIKYNILQFQIEVIWCANKCTVPLPFYFIFLRIFLINLPIMFGLH